MKQSPMYKEPTPAQRAKIQAARKRMREGMEGEKTLFAKLSTTEAKAARDEQKMAQRDMEKIPESVRNYENEEGMVEAMNDDRPALPKGEKYLFPKLKDGGMVKAKKGGMASKKAAGGAGMTRGCGAAVKGKGFKGVF